MLEELGNSIIESLGELVLGFLNVIPGLIAALIVLLFGYLVGWVVYKLLDKLFMKIKLDEMIIKKTGLAKRVGALKLGHLLAVISKWYIFILFLMPAANLVKLGALATFLVEVSFWIPSLIAAFLVVLFGVLAADYVYEKILHVKLKNAQGVAEIVRVIIVIFVALIALEQIGIKVSVAQNSFLIILGGIMLAVGLAFGIGYGLALKDTAKKSVEKWKKYF